MNYDVFAAFKSITKKKIEDSMNIPLDKLKTMNMGEVLCIMRDLEDAGKNMSLFCEHHGWIKTLEQHLNDTHDDQAYNYPR